MTSDFYLVLGINRNADTNKIKKAYRKIVKQYHPDTTELQKDSEKFREIQEAYETLGDEEKRKQYDTELTRGETPMTTTADRVLAHLQNHPEGLELKQEGNGKYRCHSPFRPGSDSHGFTLIINDGEHGAYKDFNSKSGKETGSLYDLADRLGIARNGNQPVSTKRVYTGLADYAQAHGVAADVFTVEAEEMP